MWAHLPEEIDILVTHCPPFGVCDITHKGYHVGCKYLKEAVDLVKPKVHIFGHIHESAGNVMMGSTHFYNVAFVDEQYTVTNLPIIIDLELNK